ncbi:MAG: type 2 isopentenyl-diphosphate Delta-isomerase [Tissierellia bacterium]|nr:type 2 isopentenyl-diphosphate Delta-isomerase [Tissierellia bacterium]
MRKYRKREHVENYLRASHQGQALFEDVLLPNHSLPEMALEEVDTRLSFLGRDLDFPLMINAMTGGTDFTEEINQSLAEIARHFNLPIAVGSQTIAMEDEEAKRSFQVVREVLGEDGIVLANINPHLSLDQAKKAVDMIQANGLQIHLNPAQEMAMEEGDRDFRGLLKNIQEIVEGLGLPVIVKEVGFGLSPEVIERLYQVGVRYVDVSGHGGSNFFEIEDMRRPDIDMSDLFSWGLPTAYCIIKAKELGLEDLKIIGAGGIKSAQDLVKALVLGSHMTAISGELLTYLMYGGQMYAMEYVEALIYKTRMIMLLLGAKNLKDLWKVQWLAKGQLKDLIDQRPR